ncbi:hypothetical protein PHLCEN_2v6287 [Hermanssonia centrifuga]|uniref:Uncharacterized protein n=1 Tax=Hermanssonia centrifuga TaxID=98765 RepID=A0A2R6NZV5_9APHY|nr:hypothetical protein PHLCEN_2v6287 [Hermanssonia centrifuga]
MQAKRAPRNDERVDEDGWPSRESADITGEIDAITSEIDAMTSEIDAITSEIDAMPGVMRLSGKSFCKDSAEKRRGPL